MQLENYLERTAFDRPDKTAIVYGDSRVTWGELERQSNRLAHALIADGLMRGDRVAIQLENSPETIMALFAVLKAGGVFMVLNPGVKPEKMRYILGDSEARTLISDVRHLDLLGEVWWTSSSLQSVIATDGRPVEPSGQHPRVLELETLMREHDQATEPPEKRAIDVDLAALVYTSGSTGEPKGTMLTHLNMTSAATSITTYLENTPDDIVFSVLPLSFDYGLYQALMATRLGMTLVLERGFAFPHAALSRLVKEQATGFPLVPTISAMLLQMDLSKYDLSCLRYVTNTGAALPVQHIRELRERMPHVRIYSMYGLTECKRVAYLPPDRIDERPGSVGRAMPNVEVWLADDEGRRLPNGSTGELVVRGSNVMLGYWKRPDATDERLRPGPLPGERVLHTGDVFRTDEDGFLYFVARKDDVIKSRGEKVSPKEVENVLCGIPGVADAAVVGVPDPVLGQAIKAVVSLRPDAEVTEADILAGCRDRLEDFMVPKIVEIRSELPKTAHGKIDRRSLQAEA